jgi:arsenate reductase-like glutaredoxin family protein
LQAKKIPFEEREYGRQPFSEKELRELLAGQPVEGFLNSRNALYRERNMKQNPPSKEEAIKMIVKEPNLLKRPVFVKGKKTVLGFSEPELAKLL